MAEAQDRDHMAPRGPPHDWPGYGSCGAPAMALAMGHDGVNRYIWAHARGFDSRPPSILLGQALGLPSILSLRGGSFILCTFVAHGGRRRDEAPRTLELTVRLQPMGPSAG